MKLWKKYLLTVLTGVVIVWLIIATKDIFYQTSPAVIFHILTDAFFVAGVIITAAGLLVFSSNEGTFDMLVYGVSSFVDMFRKTSQKKYETFYDYRASREEQKLKFGFLLISGLIFIGISLVMYFFYSQYSA